MKIESSKEEGLSSEVPADCREQQNNDGSTRENEEDDLEEGELRDDDDDEEEEEEVGRNNFGRDIAKQDDSKSSSDSPARPSSSSSSSSTSSSDSKEQASSKSSSKIGSYHSSSSRNNNLSNDRCDKPRLSSSRHISEERFSRGGRDREKEDPSEKAAKLISMRTKLLEARSREIELKFQKNKGLTTALKPPPRPPLSPAINSSLQRNVKMTIAKPSISYNENPNPPNYVTPTPGVIDNEKEVKSKQKNDEKDKDKKSKKKSKKKKKSSSKKHRKHKSGSVIKKSSSDSKASESQELELPHDNNLDRQGPRTPPDNHVLTLEDEQIEWPSHLIRMTITQPSISYSVNPGSMMDESKVDESNTPKKRKSSSISHRDRKKHRNDEKHSSISSSPSQRTSSPSVHKTEEGTLQPKYSSLKRASIYEADLTSDHAWYYNYFVNSYEMDHNQAQHQAYATLLSTGAYDSEVFEKWLNSRGLSRLSITDFEAQKQLYPFSLREAIPSPPGSQQSTSTKPDKTSLSETVDQPLGSSIDKVITRITRNQVNRDIDDRLNNRMEEAQDDCTKGDAAEIKDEIKTENSEIAASGWDQESETGYVGDPSSGQSMTVKLEEVTTQFSMSSPLPEDTVSLHPIQPKFTIIKSQREIVLPNGQVLPPGTIQKIVHPYPRVDSEVLGPYFDLY